MAFTWCGAAFSRRAIIFDGGGQTGSFPFCGISNHYEPNESCQTNIRIRPVCPRVRPRVPPARRLNRRLGPLPLYTLTRICSVEYTKRMESVFEIIAEPNRRAIL